MNYSHENLGTDDCNCIRVIWSQDFRFYISDLVGMLRAKQSLVMELRAAILTHLKMIRSRQVAVEVYDQDQALEVLRQVHASSFVIISVYRVVTYGYSE